MKRPLLIGLLCGVGIACAPARDTDPRVTRIREQLSLTPPYRIVSLETYLDGGSPEYVIRGGNRRSVTIGFDGRMRTLDGNDFAAYKTAYDSLGYPPPDSVPRLLYFGGHPSRGAPVSLGSPRESTLIDLLTLAAEQHIGRSWVARVDSIHDAGKTEGLYLLEMLDKEQRRYTAAAGLAWGLRGQRARGFWLAANDPSRPFLDSARVARNLPIH